MSEILTDSEDFFEHVDAIYQEALKSHKECVFFVPSLSMYPTLKPKDKIVIRKQEQYFKNDIIVFVRERQFIVHRIVKVLDHGFITKGDNNLELDLLVYFSDVRGRVLKIKDSKKNIYSTKLLIHISLRHLIKNFKFRSMNLLFSLSHLSFAKKSFSLIYSIELFLVKLYFKNDKNLNLYISGSYARAEDVPGLSDLDIVVLVNSKTNLNKLFMKMDMVSRWLPAIEIKKILNVDVIKHALRFGYDYQMNNSQRYQFLSGDIDTASLENDFKDPDFLSLYQKFSFLDLTCNLFVKIAQSDNYNHKYIYHNIRKIFKLLETRFISDNSLKSFIDDLDHTINFSNFTKNSNLFADHYFLILKSFDLQLDICISHEVPSHRRYKNRFGAFLDILNPNFTKEDIRKVFIDIFDGKGSANFQGIITEKYYLWLLTHTPDSDYIDGSSTKLHQYLLLKNVTAFNNFFAHSAEDSDYLRELLFSVLRSYCFVKYDSVCDSVDSVSAIANDKNDDKLMRLSSRLKSRAETNPRSYYINTVYILNELLER